AIPTGRRAAAPVRRQLDSPQFRHLDRPRGRQHRVGPVTPDARAPGEENCRLPLAACRLLWAIGNCPSMGGALYRRGQRLVLVVWRISFKQPGCLVRLSVSQAPAKRVLAAGGYAASGVDSAD